MSQYTEFQGSSYNEYMKYRGPALTLFSLLLIGCNVSISNVDNFLSLNAVLLFEKKETQDAEDMAVIRYSSANYPSPSYLKIDEKIVAGDQIKVIFEGEFNHVCDDSLKSNCLYEGRIKSYSITETQIMGIHVDDATIGDISNQIRTSYLLDNEYVILDEVGHYISLDDYDGYDLYLSENKTMMEENCHCPEGMVCGVCPVYVAGLYAYNPRPIS